MTETETLLPCPFCGSAPIMDVHHENEDGTGIIEFVVVRCSQCRTSKERPSPSAAAQAWNRRFDHAPCPDYVRKLEAENTALRAFAESFHVTVVDNFYQDVTLVLERPHTLAIRLRNDSTKSWIFADLENRRKAALAAASPDTSTVRPCDGCDGHECDNGCAYPGAQSSPDRGDK